jgi:cell division protein FtsQ
MNTDIQAKPAGNWIIVLTIFALILVARLVITIISDPQFFPINSLKIEASYQYLSREKIQKIISPYLAQSFLVFSEKKLKDDFKKNPWVENIYIQKLWPDHVIVQIKERFPVALWDNMLLSEKGDLFKPEETEMFADLPRFYGPKHQQTDVLHIYEKLSKLLLTQGLVIKEIRLRDNQAWEMTLSNDVIIRLGKRNIEERLMRFCKVYPKLFAATFDRVSSIDLRYSNGIAVNWKKDLDQINSNPKKQMG